MDKQTKYLKRIYRVLVEQDFVLGNKEKKPILERVSNGRRYFFMVLKRKEGDRLVERFVKIPENNTKKLLAPFRRQLEMAKYIKMDSVMNTRGVIDANFDPRNGTPFAVLETFPKDGTDIGFIDSDTKIGLLGANEARNAIDQLNKFHSIPVESLPRSLRDILIIYPGDYRGFRREMFRFLNKRVRPLDSKGEAEAFHIVLERRLGIPNIKNKIARIMTDSASLIDMEPNRVLSIVHGDVSPENLYVYDSGEVELLDLEWVGTFKNKAIAMIRDFGNLRARSWANRAFRDALDAELIRMYRSHGQEDLGKAIVRLGILRSHILLSGYFENYEKEKQKDPRQTKRRKETERDIAKAFVIK